VSRARGARTHARSRARASRAHARAGSARTRYPCPARGMRGIVHGSRTEVHPWVPLQYPMNTNKISLSLSESLSLSRYPIPPASVLIKQSNTVAVTFRVLNLTLESCLARACMNVLTRVPGPPPGVTRLGSPASPRMVPVDAGGYLLGLSRSGGSKPLLRPKVLLNFENLESCDLTPPLCDSFGCGRAAPPLPSSSSCSRGPSGSAAGPGGPALARSPRL
jgi:hypothetical protein